MPAALRVEKTLFASDVQQRSRRKVSSSKMLTTLKSSSHLWAQIKSVTTPDYSFSQLMYEGCPGNKIFLEVSKISQTKVQNISLNEGKLFSCPLISSAEQHLTVTDFLPSKELLGRTIQGRRTAARAAPCSAGSRLLYWWCSTKW